MNVAFVDTSVLLAMMFREPRAQHLVERLNAFDAVYAASLVEAEVGSACHREGMTVDDRVMAQLELVFPPHSLREEIDRVLGAGYVRGADCFHLATALMFAPNPRQLTFLTLDARQRDVAKALGFAI